MNITITLEEKMQLEARLEHLIQEKRPESVERLKIARGYGDLSENSEYDAAKDELSFVDGEIEKITEQLRQAVIIDTSKMADNIVEIGSTVTVYEHDIEKTNTYTIVGSGFADAFHNRISKESPIGSSLLHHFKEDTVVVHSPDGP